MPRVVESMTRLSVLGLKVRVWRQQAAVENTYNNQDLTARANSLVNASVFDIRTVAEALAALPGVNAVEVLGVNDCGVVIYPDWKEPA